MQTLSAYKLGCLIKVSHELLHDSAFDIASHIAKRFGIRFGNAEEEAFINGKEVTADNINAFAEKVLEDINPRDSWRASKALRQHVAVESAKRCMIESVKLAGGVL